MADLKESYIAHKRECDGAEQLLIDHLRGTAELAAAFAAKFRNEDNAWSCGMLHDLGKSSKEGQYRLRGNGPKCDHSTAGAVEAYRNIKLYGKLLAYCIAGHHSGLQNAGYDTDTYAEGTLKGRLSESYIDRLPDYSAFLKEIQNESFRFNTPPQVRNVKDKEDLDFVFYMLIKMLYSSLVDADYLDTERFMNPQKCRDVISCDFRKLRDKLKSKYAEFKDGTGIVNEKRREVLRDCLKAAAADKGGIFSLTVPTGGGKTLSSMAFALEHAINNGMDRIIYVIPYTSIIEQNAAVFREIFGDKYILEHHSNYDFEDDENDDRKRLAAENWDMPIVVTTNVQFFESIFSNRSSRSRKIHNLANSVIIFDEVQMLPTEYLKACMGCIGELARGYECTIVLCSATQPPLHKFMPADLKPAEIVNNYKELYETLKRAEVTDIDILDYDDLVRYIRNNEQSLTIVNTRAQARKMYEMLKERGAEDIYHLSTLICAEDRKRVIKEIKERLDAGKPCRVISTCLIEAGVDVDFPIVFKCKNGCDTIVQAAGRCNREGKLKDKDGRPVKGKVFVFEFQDEKVPKSFMMQAEVCNEVSRNFDDISCIEAIEAYFEKLYFYRGEADTDRKDIYKRIKAGMSKQVRKGREQEDLLNYDFKNIAEDFHIIEETFTVVIPKNSEALKLIEVLRAGALSRALMRKLQPFTVNIRKFEYGDLKEKGLLEVISEDVGVLTDMRYYSEAKGLDVMPESGKGLFI